MNYSMFLGLFIFMSGFIIGLGAVTVIDILGFLARKSSYWTQTTIRTHKVTKVLIWLGISLSVIGAILFYSNYLFNNIILIHSVSLIFLILNGMFLSFKVSPYLIKKEINNKDTELISKSWQHKIIVSFLLSLILWWSNLALFVIFIYSRLLSI